MGDNIKNSHTVIFFKIAPIEPHFFDPIFDPIVLNSIVKNKAQIRYQVFINRQLTIRATDTLLYHKGLGASSINHFKIGKWYPQLYILSLPKKQNRNMSFYVSTQWNSLKKPSFSIFSKANPIPFLFSVTQVENWRKCISRGNTFELTYDSDSCHFSFSKHSNTAKPLFCWFLQIPRKLQEHF